MELRQLKYFAAVAETLNFSEAAKKLFITQGTLSQQVRQLEGELGAELFERSSHSVRMTEAGEELLPMAQKMLETSDECLIKISDLRHALSGTLKIGVTHSFSHLLPEPVKIFLRAHPGVKMKIYYKTASELVDMLMAGEVDFIITFKPSTDHESISWESIMTTQLSAVMWNQHPLADRKILTVNDISRYGIILPSAGLQSRKVFDRFTNVDTSSLNVKIEINEPNIILDILYGTQMIGILSSLATRFHNSLVAIPVEEFQHKLSGCVQWLNTSYQKRSVNAFLEIFKESIR